MKILFLIFLPVLAYLLGSVPFGLVLTRLFTNIDIRKEGSGNIGATNVRRTAGNLLGVLTLAGDVAKGAIPVGLGIALFHYQTWGREPYLGVLALCAFAGHLFPVYLRFRDGGKGVATAAGAFAAFSPGAVVVALMVFVMMVCFTGRVSVGSMTASATLPVAVWEATGSSAMTAAAAVAAVLILIRHRENIKRLIAGKEPSVFR